MASIGANLNLTGGPRHSAKDEGEDPERGEEIVAMIVSSATRVASSRSFFNYYYYYTVGKFVYLC